jgi:archaeal type IV pilus assembly protein PilA
VSEQIFHAAGGSHAGNGAEVEFQMQFTESDERAVSPVVGVMLMLVVTIIIAAVVSAFAGGLGGTQQKTPAAVLDINIHSLENQGAMPGYGSGYYIPTMTITEISGDALPTKDLKITTSFTNSSGTTFTGNLSGEVAVTGNDGWNSYTSSQYAGVLYLSDINRFGWAVQNTDHGFKGWFGNSSAVLQPGDTLTTPAQYCGNYNDNTGPSSPHTNPGMNYLLGFDVTEQEKVGGFGPGSVVEVKILHTPSGKMIADQKVVVE